MRGGRLRGALSRAREIGVAAAVIVVVESGRKGDILRRPSSSRFLSFAFQWRSRSNDPSLVEEKQKKKEEISGDKSSSSSSSFHFE